MASSGRVFSATIVKGYTFKVAIDTLNGGSLQRACFILDREGIRLRQPDQGNTVLYNVYLPRKNLLSYECVKPLTISVNVKHLHTLLKNVKKKDALTMSIERNSDKLSITISQDSAKKISRSETNSIVFQEEREYVPIELPEGGYGYPMVIEAADFQKIKRLTTMGKIVTVTIQGSNYLSFKVDAGVVYDSELKFGSIIEGGDEPQTLAIEPKKGKCEGCGRSVKRCSCICDECDESLADCTCDKSQGDSVDPVFSAQYYSSILNKLVKLPGLCTQLQFYAPTVSNYPLKIEANAGQNGFTLGTIQVYVKDVNQIQYEESIRDEESLVNVAASSKGKGKTKKAIKA